VANDGIGVLAAGGLATWFAGTAAALTAWAAQGVASIANAAAEVTCAQAVAKAKPLLERELGGSVQTGPLLTKGYGREGQTALLHVSFAVCSGLSNGLAEVEAAVLPGGRLELRRVALDGRRLEPAASSTNGDVTVPQSGLVVDTQGWTQG